MERGTVTIEEKRFSQAATDNLVVKALRGRRGQVTLADAVAVSGLPTHLVEPSLERLLGTYRSHLAVTEEGELLYSFEPAFQRRGVPTLAERLTAAGRFLARIAVRVFKALIAVVLVVYVVVFVLLLLAVMMSASRRDDHREGGWGGRDDRGFGGGGMGWVWWFLMPRYGWGWGWGTPTDAWGRTREPLPGTGRRSRRGPRKPFIHMVYDFVFGPAAPTRDPQADERELLAYVRANAGRLTATDLVGLFGWSYRQAEEEATRLLVDYDGEPEVTEEGVLIYAFPKLLKSAADSGAGAGVSRSRAPAWRQAWDRLEPRPLLTGNGTGANVLIGGFATFNLLMSLRAADWARMTYGIQGPAADFGLTIFPLAFFGLFLGVPILRAFARRAGDRGRARRNGYRLVVRDVLASPGVVLPDSPALRAAALDLEGEPDLHGAGDEATPVWKFPRVAEEKTAFARHLTGVDLEAERRLGKVIFGSQEEGAGMVEGPERRRERELAAQQREAEIQRELEGELERRGRELAGGRARSPKGRELTGGHEDEDGGGGGGGGGDGGGGGGGGGGGDGGGGGGRRRPS